MRNAYHRSRWAPSHSAFAGSLAEVARLLGGKVYGQEIVCPAPGHSRKDRSLSVRLDAAAPDGFVVYGHAGDDWRACRDHVHALLGGAARLGSQPSRVVTRNEPRAPAPAPGTRDEEQLRKGRWMWQRSVPAIGTPVEPYLLQSRGIPGPVPPSLRFLAPYRAGQHPAMIAAFGLPHECRPGETVMPVSRVMGIHLTLLNSNGTGKADVAPNKLMIGALAGWPIVIVPPNDLGGLAIAEGIEEALTLHRATGLGAWAAGSANRLPKLADVVPGYVEVVTIVVDDDAAGRHGSLELAQRLEVRGLEVIMLDPSAKLRAAA